MQKFYFDEGYEMGLYSQIYVSYSDWLHLTLPA